MLTTTGGLRRRQIVEAVGRVLRLSPFRFAQRVACGVFAIVERDCQSDSAASSFVIALM
jgi:hypothetical protein